MAILLVYLPKYSTTYSGFAKGRLQYTTQSLANRLSLNPCGRVNSLRTCSTKRALKTLLIAVAGNRYLPLLLAYFHFPLAETPPPGTMQCRCGCRLRFWPQVCSIATMPMVPPRNLGLAPKSRNTLHALLNKMVYTVLGAYRQSWFNVSGKVNTTWK